MREMTEEEIEKGLWYVMEQLRDCPRIFQRFCDGELETGHIAQPR